MPLDPDHVRAFLDRPWDELAEGKRAHWASRTPAERLQAAQALAAHLRAIRPGWPDEAYLAEDLEHHVELKRLLDRAARALAAR